MMDELAELTVLTLPSRKSYRIIHTIDTFPSFVMESKQTMFWLRMK